MTDADNIISISDDSDDEPSRPSAQQQQQTQVKRNVAVKRTSNPQPTQPVSSTSSFYNNSKQRDKEAAEFLNGFDPDHSRRELSKRNVLLKPPPPRNTKKNNSSLFDDLGRYRGTLYDLCDCLTPNCRGCHFPCDSCGSRKCATKCRINRKWAYEKVEYDGKQDSYKENDHLKKIKSGF